MDLARDALDASGEQSEMTPNGAAAPGIALDATADSDNEPVLGPLGQRLLTVGVIVGVVILIVVLVWLMGMLAYTSPPTPGAG